MKTVITALTIFCLVTTPALAQVRCCRVTASIQPSGDLLTLADLTTCAGKFKTPQVNSGLYTTSYPVTIRYIGGVRHWLIYEGNGHLTGFQDPTLSSCGTAIGSTVTASKEAWGGDWGTIPVHAGDDQYIPGNPFSSTQGSGLFVDSITGKGYLSWAATYAAVLQYNSFARYAFDDTGHTLTVEGCWRIAGTYNTTQVGTGILNIPASFVSNNLSAGRRLGVGFGGHIGYASAVSEGVVITAIDVPSNNACASSTDYDIASTTLLERHAVNNGVGPHCHPFSINGSDYPSTMGCTPAIAPTNPKAAEQAFADYSEAMYPQSWVPYGGHGWIGWTTSVSPAWYDDGVKQGVVMAYSTPTGWLNTTVKASPSPTSTTMSINSVDRHDGGNVQVGEHMWVETCTVGVDGAGCQITNMTNFSEVVVSTVNTGTGAITFSNIGADSGSGGHVPLAGGLVVDGCTYFKGNPGCTALTFRRQIYDPTQYAEVVAGSRQPYNVKYVEEESLMSTVTDFGSYPLSIGHRALANNIADPIAHQVVSCVVEATTGIGVTQDLCYVWDVSQVRPHHVAPAPDVVVAPILLVARPEPRRRAARLDNPRAEA